MDSVLVLIGYRQRQNDLGVWEKEKPCRREVFCKVNSISRAEFFSAGRNGLNPEWQFEIFAGVYNGETVCEYDGKTYGIYRTYHVPGTDYMELYAERKGGANGE
ncbi:MAG: phage head-tail adapter protein [Clostridia bacterium]|nr:phage head-tail adapter protein [Clostridia bacterium]